MYGFCEAKITCFLDKFGLGLPWFKKKKQQNPS